MPEISFEDSIRQTNSLSRRADEAAQAGWFDDTIALWRELLTHPCAHHQVNDYEIWDEIYQVQRRAGRYDAAIVAKQTAIEAGYRSDPDPQADIAECHLLAGRRDDADRIFAYLRSRTPDDVWLYNSAGISYAEAGDHTVAERWLRNGIDVALRTGDPDQVVVQLLDFLDESLRARGQEPDIELTERIEDFCTEWQPVYATRTWTDLPPAQGTSLRLLRIRPRSRLCERTSPSDSGRHLTPRGARCPCPTRRAASHAPRTRRRIVAQRPRSGRGMVPPPRRMGARRRTLARSTRRPAQGPRRLQPRDRSCIKRIAKAAPGRPRQIAPVVIDRLVAHANRQAMDPGTAEARSAYAAHLSHAGDTQLWPPGRNERCWCGSGRKYKHCCDPIPATADN